MGWVTLLEYRVNAVSVRCCILGVRVSGVMEGHAGGLIAALAVLPKAAHACSAFWLARSRRRVPDAP